MNVTRGQHRSPIGLSFSAPAARPRPMLPAAIGFMLGILVSECTGELSTAIDISALMAAICVCLLMPMLAARRRASATALHAVVVLSAFGFGFARQQAAMALPANHVTRLVGNERILTRVAGRIVTRPTTAVGEKRNPYLHYEPEPRTRFVLAASELRTADSPTPIRGNIRVSVTADGISADLGDEVVVTGWMYSFRGPRNPGEADWARSYRLRNIHAGLSTESAALVCRESAAGGAGWRGLVWFRGRARALLFEPLDEGDSDQPRRLLDTMVLGNRSAAGRALNDAFLRTGTIHFLTVSGFHVGVLGGAVWLLLRRVLRRGPRLAAICSAGVLLTYAIIVEPNAPVMRATIMGVLLCVAQIARRPLCGMNWLSLAALCVLALNPLELFRPGFQLSFVQVVAILTIVPRVYRLLTHRDAEGDVPADAETWRALVLRRAWRWLAGLVAVCVVAWAVSLPLVLHHFGRFAPWGALQSIVISPLVMLVIVLGFATLAASAALPPLGVVAGELLRGVTQALLWVVDRLGNWPHTLVETPHPPTWLVVLTYAAVLAMLWAWHRPKVFDELHQFSETTPVRRSRWRIATLTVLAAALVCSWGGWLLTPRWDAVDDVTLHVFSVGSGSAALIMTPDRHAMLCDAGTIGNFDAGETVATAAWALGVDRVDRITISHANFDHYGGVGTVARRLSCGGLFLSRYFEQARGEDASVGRFLDSLPASVPRSELRAGDRFSLGDASVDVLWPPDGIDDQPANDRSLVLLVTAFGRRILIPGDIESAALRGLVDLHESGKIDLRADVLIAPHHGSVLPHDSAAFYEVVTPSVVINSTGHERPELARMLSEIGGEKPIRLLSTHAVGAVTVRVTPAGEMRIETPFAGKRRDGHERPPHRSHGTTIDP